VGDDVSDPRDSEPDEPSQVVLAIDPSFAPYLLAAMIDAGRALGLSTWTGIR